MNGCSIPNDAEKYVIDFNNALAIYQEKEESEYTNYLVYFYEYFHHKTNGYFDLAIFTWNIEEKLEHTSTYMNFLSIIKNQAVKLKFKD